MQEQYEMNLTPDTALERAARAFSVYRKASAAERAVLLETIAAEIQQLGETLIETASRESRLPVARLAGERGRTCNQLLAFAAMLREGSWVDASIDTAQPDRTPPKPDVRSLLVPLGPVVVFGASNFPLAFSTAGGDTASALAAGCTVVIKAHPAHPQTSRLVFGAIQKALEKTNLPGDTVLHVEGAGNETGKHLVSHPLTTAVGFTGSQQGGLALLEYARERTNPIPVFAEMGSVNPVVLLPEKVALDPAALAGQLAGSITLGAGQFCTNPGLLLGIAGDDLDLFKKELACAVAGTEPAPMLHQGIHDNYYSKMSKAVHQQDVAILYSHEGADVHTQARPVIATVPGKVFLINPGLSEEIFGPYALLVECADMAELEEVWRSTAGQLTTTFMGTGSDFEMARAMIDHAADIAGRLIFNQVPTGVEVCPSMVHGGPYPATSDPRFTSVGLSAVRRWVKPFSYQNCPDAWLPDALKNGNPLNINRLLNGVLTKATIS